MYKCVFIHVYTPRTKLLTFINFHVQNILFVFIRTQNNLYIIACGILFCHATELISSQHDCKVEFLEDF